MCNKRLSEVLALGSGCTIAKQLLEQLILLSNYAHAIVFTLKVVLVNFFKLVCKMVKKFSFNVVHFFLSRTPSKWCSEVLICYLVLSKSCD